MLTVKTCILGPFRAILVTGICLAGPASADEEIQKSAIVLETNVSSPMPAYADPYKLIDGIQYSGGVSLWQRGSDGYLLFDLQAISFLTIMNVQYTSTTHDSLELLVSTDNNTYQSLGMIHFPSWNGMPSVNRAIGAFARWVKFVMKYTPLVSPSGKRP